MNKNSPLWNDSLAVVPPKSDARWQSCLTQTGSATHSRHAWGFSPQRLSDLQIWIEPSACRDDAISEARRIAQEDSIFGTGFAWESMGRWYAHSQRPGGVDTGMWGAGGGGEVVTIEVPAGERVAEKAAE